MSLGGWVPLTMDAQRAGLRGNDHDGMISGKYGYHMLTTQTRESFGEEAGHATVMGVACIAVFGTSARHSDGESGSGTVVGGGQTQCEAQGRVHLNNFRVDGSRVRRTRFDVSGSVLVAC
jgi:hypothetical protein